MICKRFPSIGMLALGWSKLTDSSCRVGVCLLKDEKLRGLLILQIIPLVGWIVVHLQILRSFRLKHHVSRHQVIGLHAAGVTQRERPVSQWPAQRFPNTMKC